MAGFSLFLAVNQGTSIFRLEFNNPAPSPTISGCCPKLIEKSFNQANAKATSLALNFNITVVPRAWYSSNRRTQAISKPTVRPSTSCSARAEKNCHYTRWTAWYSCDGGGIILNKAGIPYTTVDTQVIDPTEPQNYVERNKTRRVANVSTRGLLSNCILAMIPTSRQP